MPWTAADARRHDKQADTPAKRAKWAAIANAVLKRTGDEVLAIKTANARTESVDEAITPERKAWKKRGQTLRSMLEKGRRAEFERIGAIDPKELERHGIDQTKPRGRKLGRPHNYPKAFTQQPPKTGGWAVDALAAAANLLEGLRHLERKVQGIGRQLAQHRPWEAPAPGAAPIDATKRLGLLRDQAGAQARIDAKLLADRTRKQTRKDEKEAAARLDLSQKRNRAERLAKIKDKNQRLALASGRPPQKQALVASVDLDRSSLLYENEPTQVIEPPPPPPSSPRIRPKTVKLPPKAFLKPSGSTASVHLPLPTSVTSLRKEGARGQRKDTAVRKERLFGSAVLHALDTADKMAAMGVERPAEPPTFHPTIPERTPLRLPSPSDLANRIQRNIQGELNPKAAAFLAQIRAIGQKK